MDQLVYGGAVVGRPAGVHHHDNGAFLQTMSAELHPDPLVELQLGARLHRL